MTTFLSRWPWRGPLAGPDEPKTGSVRELDLIALAHAEMHNITVKDLKGLSQRRKHAWPRQEAMAAAYATGRFTLERIGGYFGGRDHGTVHYAIQRVRERAESDLKLKRSFGL